MQRTNILGVGVHEVCLHRATRLITEAASQGRKGYVSVTGVHGIMEALRHPEFKSILNQSFLVVPDGMPAVWVGRLQGFQKISRVYGPDLMLKVCEQSVALGQRHFLYGGKEGVAEELAAFLEKSYPGIRIAGTYTPPFRSLTHAEEEELAKLVVDSAPDIFWVGLSTPKQERFMARYLSKLQTKVMIGVGAAFDIHTGRTKDAPGWVKTAGLQWCHRLLQEPRRLWKRYLVNNPAFLFWITVQFVGLRRFVLEE